MTDPLNSPCSLRIGETTSRMLQREPSLLQQHRAAVVLDALPEAGDDRHRGDLLAAFLVDRRIDLVEGSAHRLRRRNAGQLLGDRVHEGDAGRRVGADHRIADRIQGDPQPLLFVGKLCGGKRQPFLGLLEAGDVGVRSDRPDAHCHRRRARAPCRGRAPRSSALACGACGIRLRRTASCRRYARGRRRSTASRSSGWTSDSHRSGSRVELVLAIAQHLLPDRRIVAASRA